MKLDHCPHCKRLADESEDSTYFVLIGDYDSEIEIENSHSEIWQCAYCDGLILVEYEISRIVKLLPAQE